MDKALALRLRLEGLSYSEIARQLGVSRQYVRQVLPTLHSITITVDTPLYLKLALSAEAQGCTVVELVRRMIIIKEME